jgi:tRNA (guanine-N7-)-methyltransferase
MAESRGSERGFFGRRKGKALRPQRAERLARLLPELGIDLKRDLAKPETLFRAPVSGLRLEIGFGGGEHLLHEARRHPETGFIGCEPFINGMAKLVDAIAREGLANIRLFDDDARGLIDALPDRSVTRIDILYPDPWPKRRQRKRRFVSDATLAAMARVLVTGGELRFATDIDDYAGWTLARILRSRHFCWSARSASDWRSAWPDWPGTRYEAKAKRAGREPIYLTFNCI